MSKTPKIRWKSIKIANIEREIVHIFWTTWGISMEFSGKVWLMIILKLTKNQCFILSLKDTFFEKPQMTEDGGGGVGGGGDQTPPAVLGLSCTCNFSKYFVILPVFRKIVNLVLFYSFFFFFLFVKIMCIKIKSS